MTGTNRNGLNVTGASEGKDTTLTAHEQRLCSFLLGGGQWSAKQFMQELPDRDPRSTIRFLRNKGIAVGDKWVQGEYSRHKLYFIHL